MFRLLIYLLLRKANAFLRKLTENEETKIFRNKHILSYVVGLGFGAMAGAFSMVNVLADRDILMLPLQIFGLGLRKFQS